MILSKNLPLLNSLTTIIIVISVSILLSLSVLSSPMQFNSVKSYAQQSLQSASPLQVVLHFHLQYFINSGIFHHMQLQFHLVHQISQILIL
jgi:hypothetical protein